MPTAPLALRARALNAVHGVDAGALPGEECSLGVQPLVEDLAANSEVGAAVEGEDLGVDAGVREDVLDAARQIRGGTGLDSEAEEVALPRALDKGAAK